MEIYFERNINQFYYVLHIVKLAGKKLTKNTDSLNFLFRGQNQWQKIRSVPLKICKVPWKVTRIFQMDRKFWECLESKKEVSLKKCIFNLTKINYGLQKFENIWIFELGKFLIYFLMFEKVYKEEKIMRGKNVFRNWDPDT